jgi:hypothetical protein
MILRTSNRSLSCLALAAAAIFLASTALMAIESDFESIPLRPAAVLKIPKGLTGFEAVNGLAQPNVTDRYALAVFPYQPAPKTVKLHRRKAVRHTSYPR